MLSLWQRAGGQGRLGGQGVATTREEGQGIKNRVVVFFCRFRWIQTVCCNRVLKEFTLQNNRHIAQRAEANRSFVSETE